jgi:hypothetical protein
MPPSPEKLQNQPPASEVAEAFPKPQHPHGIRLGALVISPTWEVGVEALILEFTPGEVILLLDDPVTAKTHVSVQVNTCSFYGEILFCEPEGSRWKAHISFDDTDASGLRRTPRFPVRIPARIFTSTNELPVEGLILDVSGEGLGIELAERLPPKTNIAVQSDENIALGEVRHCRELPSGLFRAGVELRHIIGKDRELQKAESGWMNKLGARFGRKRPDRSKS